MSSLLTTLTTHLREQLDLFRIRDEQWGIDIEGGRIVPGGMDTTEQGIHAADYHYTAVISFERFPGDSLQLLLLVIVLWLGAHDTARQRYGLPWPQVDAMPLADGLYDVAITIDFVDQFHLGPSENGPLVIDGQTYAVNAWELWTAESGTVEGAPV